MSEKNESVEQKAEAQQETPKVIYIYKKRKNKKKKKTNPKPCRNGGYRWEIMKQAMTPVEINQVEAVRGDLNRALADLDTLKKRSDSLSEYVDRVFGTLSLGNIDGYIGILNHQVKPILTKIKETRETIKKLRTKQKELLAPVIKRLDNINSKEPFKPQEVLRRFTADVKAGESTPKKGSYNLSRHDALMLVKEISDVITGNPKAQRIEIFIASN